MISLQLVCCSKILSHRLHTVSHQYKLTLDFLVLRSNVGLSLLTDGNPVAVTEGSVSLSTPAQPTHQEETWEVPREIEDLMKNSADADIILMTHQTPVDIQDLYSNTDRVTIQPHTI